MRCDDIARFCHSTEHAKPTDGGSAMPESDTREIFKRLGELERKVDVLISRTPEQLDVRLNDLERSEEDRKWLFRAIVTGMMGMGAAVVHLFFSSKN